jgi:hypothetical protein
MRLFTFGDIVIGYQRQGQIHRLQVASKAGPWLITVEHPIISYEYAGRYFVGQSLTEDLPTVFELVPALEVTLTTIPPEETMQ